MQKQTAIYPDLEDAPRPRHCGDLERHACNGGSQI